MPALLPTTDRERERPQSYVQSIFTDRDAAMVCEASSGPIPGEPSFVPSEQARAALHRLGYRQEDPKKSFSRVLRFGDPPDVGIAADLMLRALFDAYGAALGTSLEVDAPRGGGGTGACGAPVS